MMNSYFLDKQVANAVNEIATNVEKTILLQLSDLIGKGLLIIRKGPGILTYSNVADKLEYSHTIMLELKDQEYIKKLETELEKYRKIEEIMKGTI